MRYVLILKNRLFATLLLMMMTTSCIYDNYGDCVTASVIPQMKDQNGKILSESTVGYIKAYFFINDKYDHAVIADKDGKYSILFDGNAKISFAFFGLPKNDSIMVNTPKDGEDITDLAVYVPKTVTKAAVTLTGVLPSYTFYGRYDYISSDLNGTTNYIPLHNNQATAHVVIENIAEAYGAGSNYSVVVKGLRNGVGFDGNTTGDSITYSPRAALVNGNLVSNAFRTFPTKKDESVTVYLYKDGTLLLTASKDATGNQVTLAAGDDKAIIIKAGGSGGNGTIRVLPWDAYINQVVQK